MRIVIAIVLGIIAVAAAGVWLLGEFGGGAAHAPIATREPLVREPEVIAPLPPAPQDQSALRSAPAVEPAPAPEPEAAPTEDPAPAPESSAAPEAAPRILTERLSRESQSDATTPAPQPEASSEAQQQSAPADTQTTRAADASSNTTSGVAADFKSRRVTYNRPPERLILDRAIDVSLVINATDDPDAGADALQGFPGTVVDRDVDLSDIVSAQLTGVGFDITAQTVERQKLSSRTINRWQWRVTPTEVGSRTLILEIFGYESGSLDAEPLDAYRDEIVVEVEQLDQIIGWARSVQPVFAVLAGVAGALSALFAFLRFREEKKRNTPSV